MRKDRLLEVTFSVRHDGCWTTFVGDYVVKTLHLSVNTERDYIRSIIVLDKKHKDLISKIKRAESFRDYYSISLTDDDKKIMFDFRKRYRNSVMEAVHSVDGIVLGGFKHDGKEYWRILIYESFLNELRSKLESKGEVEFFSPLEVVLQDDELSPQEIRTIFLAYKHGYFEFPRKIKSDEISKLINVSKSTFTYHLRSAESKILRRYLSELKFYNLVGKDGG